MTLNEKFTNLARELVFYTVLQLSAYVHHPYTH